MRRRGGPSSTGNNGDTTGPEEGSSSDHRKGKPNSSTRWIQVAGVVVISACCLAMIFLYRQSSTGTAAASSPNSSASNRLHSPHHDTVSYEFFEAFREESDFVLPQQLLTGLFHPFVWKDDSKLVDSNGGLIGLPPELTREIYKFCDQIGLLEHFEKLLYDKDEAMGMGEVKLLDMKNTKSKWAAMTPKKTANWQESDIHWVDVVDEYSYEETLRVLERGNFDVVLEAIGKRSGAKGLMVAGMGFIIASYTKHGGHHKDLPDSGGFWWDLLFPLVLPKETPANIVIGDDLVKRRFSQFPLTPNVGLTISGDTTHATGECDFRSTGEYRVAVSIYVVDVNPKTAKIVSEDGTALFPVPHNTDWLLAQEGRLWSQTSDASLKNDKGRSPFVFEDKHKKSCRIWAEEGLCETELWDQRLQCPKSCGIYIDDREYYSKFFPSLSSR